MDTRKCDLMIAQKNSGHWDNWDKTDKIAGKQCILSHLSRCPGILSIKWTPAGWGAGCAYDIHHGMGFRRKFFPRVTVV